MKHFWTKGMLAFLGCVFVLGLSACSKEKSVELNDFVEGKGVEAVSTFDAFEGLEVKFTGVGPNGTASLVTEGVSEAAKMLTFKLDVDRGLSDGDVVTVEIDTDIHGDSEEYFVRLCGAVPETTEKQYVVEGLGSYAVALTQIPKDTMNDMDQWAREYIQRHVEVDWSQSEELKSMELLGNYWLTPRTDVEDCYNALFFVYKINLVNSSAPEGMSYYHYTLYENIAIMPDGSGWVDLDAAVLPQGYYSYSGPVGEAFLRDDYWYIGYEELDALFENCVSVNMDGYDYISTVREEKEEDDSGIKKTVDNGNVL